MASLQLRKIVFATLFTAIFLLSVATQPASAQTRGVIYINTNQVANEVWTYTRGTNGKLTFVGAFPTQGAGTGTGPLLNSQNAIMVSQDGRYLVVVNTGSNELTAFKIMPRGQLSFINKVPSGGQFPISLANFGSLVYVLNAHAQANINAFRLKNGGVLKNMAGTKRFMSAPNSQPTEVAFNSDGTILVAVELMTNKIDTFTIDAEGRATGPLVQNSNGSGPFGFAFDNAGHLLVSESNPSAMSSYSVDSGGVISTITNSLSDLGAAACWVANTNNPSLPNQYSYVTNTNSDSVSAYNIFADGSLSLVDADGVTVQLPTGAHPIDDVLSVDSKFLYVLGGLNGDLWAFQVNLDGSLTQIQMITGLPISSQGMIGN